MNQPDVDRADEPGGAARTRRRRRPVARRPVRAVVPRRAGASALTSAEGGSRIGYWIFNFEPKWEAASREVEFLRESFGPTYGARMTSLDLWGERVKIRGRDKHLPLPWSLVGLPWLLRSSREVDLNHLFASPGERLLLPRLARLERTVLTITKKNPTLAGFERNRESLRALRRIVVESERHADLLLQVGVEERAIRLIRPGVPREPYRPATGPLTILFASSPRKDDLLTRGIYLMIRVAERMPQVRFRLVWRRNPEKVEQLLEGLGLPNVELVSGLVEDMKAMYDAAHAVILPALEDGSMKPSPHSGIHGLAHGKPLLVSSRVDVAPLVRQEGCGVVFEPNVSSLARAIVELRTRYEALQARAHPALERHFSQGVFLERHAELYSSLLGEPPNAADRRPRPRMA